MLQLKDDEMNFIKQLLVERFQAHTIILFGSAARGELRADSDVDIALVAQQAIDPYELFIVSGELADFLGREVDLIDFSTSSTVFKAQILHHYNLLLDDAPVERQYAFMRALKEYAYLNDERMSIITKEFDFFDTDEGKERV